MLAGISRRRVRRFLLDQYQNLLTLRSVFDPRLRHAPKCEWLLILTFPNGGSTALAKTLLTARRTEALTPNAEGQWLLPRLSAPGRRWDPGYHVRPRKIRAVWLQALRARGLLGERRLIVEKSPPHMCRLPTILEALGDMNSKVIGLTRDPYAVCASWHGRYGREEVLTAWKPRTRRPIRTDTEFCELLGQIWLERARALYTAKGATDLWIRYEELTDYPEQMIRRIRDVHPLLRDVSSTPTIRVKDYPPRPLTNMNEQQIGILSGPQLAAISSALRDDEALVRALGYAIRW